MFSSILANNWSMRPSIPSSFASRAEAVLSPLEGVHVSTGLFNSGTRVLHTLQALEMPCSGRSQQTSRVHNMVEDRFFHTLAISEFSA